MRAEQTESFFGCMSCNCSAAELAALSQPLVGWLVDSPPSPHAPPRLASPSRRERGECSAAEGHRRRRLRVRRRPAPPEPTGLDLVTVVASPATVRRSATVPSPQKQLISQSGLPQCVRLSFTGREEEQLCLLTVRGQRLSPAVYNDLLEVTTSTRSRTRSSRRDGWCAWHARPSTRRRGWTSSATEWRCSTRTAAMAPRCAHVPPHTPATVGGATRSDPQLLSIASSGSPECRMRCAIAHF